MHPTPWSLPDCAELEELDTTAYDNIPGIDIKDVAVMFKQDTYLNNVNIALFSFLFFILFYAIPD